MRACRSVPTAWQTSFLSTVSDVDCYREMPLKAVMVLLTEVVPDFEADTSLGELWPLLGLDVDGMIWEWSIKSCCVCRPHKLSRVHRRVLVHPVQSSGRLHACLHHGAR